MVRGAACLALAAMLPLGAANASDLAVSIVESHGDSYIEPAGDVFVITSQPLQLYIRVRNTSGDTVKLRTDPESAYSIEFQDENGRTTVMKRKWEIGERPDTMTFKAVSAGDSEFIQMAVDNDTWEGVPDLKPGIERKFQVRAIYEDAEDVHTYSKPYTMIFRIK